MIFERLASSNYFNILFYLRCLSLLGLVYTMFLGIAMIVLWQDLTPCFQRQGTVVGIGILYLCSDIQRKFSMFIDFALFMVVFMFTQEMNARSAHIDNQCLNANNFLRKMISVGYGFTFFLYVLSFIVAILFIIAILIARKMRELHDREHNALNESVGIRNDQAA